VNPRGFAEFAVVGVVHPRGGQKIAGQRGKKSRGRGGRGSSAKLL